MSGYDSEYVIFVHTGDVVGAGTDADVSIVLHDERGNSTGTIALDNFFKNDFERGNLDTFKIATKHTDCLVAKMKKIELWRNRSGLKSSWYVEKIVIENRATNDSYVFPVFRWVRPECHYEFRHLDTSLPQNDESPTQRKAELEEKRKVYKLGNADSTLPVQVAELPVEEQFSSAYRWDMQKLKYNMIFQSGITVFTTGNWETLKDLKNLYTRDIFTVPKCYDLWREDWYFGYQRICGVNPTLITLCKNIPNKFAVDEGMLKPFLEGRSLKSATDENRLFIIDLEFFHNFPCKSPDLVIPAPIALFYVNNKNQLIPIALQLFQKPGPTNPVFLPSDPPLTWQVAKMWYTVADSTYHQSLTHLGFTHLIMESFALATHRNLSQAHPIHRLLSPHFLYLLAINEIAVGKLLAPGGWIDKTMCVGREGVLQVVRKGMTMWRLDTEGTLPEALKARGVLDPTVLPGYHYREDALLLYKAIHKYVAEYVQLYYDTEELLQADHEIQNWGKELVRERSKGGMGILGVPGNGHFTNTDDLIKTLTSCIFTCSVQHAAANFPQYDTYGFPPNYAVILRGRPPQDKTPKTEADIIDSLPDKSTTLETMTITKLLSQRGTKSLGNFEVQYVFDPKAKEIVDRFRADIEKVGKTIKQRIAGRSAPAYDYLDPDAVPNSISI